MDKIELAVDCFKKGFTCGQAVLSTFAQELGLERDLAFKVACAFGGGMARMGKTCGAVTGAFMVIGLKYGRTKVEDNDAREKTYELVKEFVRRFESLNNSIVCKELLGLDISTPDGRRIAEEQKLYTTLCPKFVKDAAEIIEEIL